MQNKCPFCNLEAGRSPSIENDLCYSIKDKYPVAKGHTLIIPKRHTAHYFELTKEEKVALWSLVDEVVYHLQQTMSIDGFNIGFNVQKAAGQTVFHTHIHVIPRVEGDCIDPTGGIRNIFPNKGRYK